MTRKDYVQVAAILQAAGTKIAAKDQCLATLVAWGQVVVDLAGMFARDNERFDRSRFYAACNFDPELWEGWQR